MRSRERGFSKQSFLESKRAKDWFASIAAAHKQFAQRRQKSFRKLILKIAAGTPGVAAISPQPETGCKKKKQPAGGPAASRG